MGGGASSSLPDPSLFLLLVWPGAGVGGGLKLTISDIILHRRIRSQRNHGDIILYQLNASHNLYSRSIVMCCSFVMDDGGDGIIGAECENVKKRLLH